MTSTATHSGFKLRAVVRTQIKGRTEAPSVLADELFDMIPESEYPDIVRKVALPALISEIRSAGRATGILNTSETARRTGGLPAYQRQLRHRDRLMQYMVALDLAGTTRKPLFNCSAKDLEAAAGVNDAISKSNLDQAEKYRRIAVLMRKRRAKTVGDLKPADVEAILDES